MNCLRCNKEFTPTTTGRRGRPQIFCSRDCWYQSWYEARRSTLINRAAARHAKEKERRRQDFWCKECGGPWKPGETTGKFCSEQCRSENKARNKKPKKLQICTECGSEFTPNCNRQFVCGETCRSKLKRNHWKRQAAKRKKLREENVARFMQNFTCSVCGMGWPVWRSAPSNLKIKTCSKQCRQWRETDKSTQRARNDPEYAARKRERCRRWDNLNRAAETARRRIRRKNNPQVKIAHRLRGRFYELRKQNFRKTNSALVLLGCSVEEFKNHIAFQFTPAMSWENWGTFWELDHKQPCASFDLTDPRQQAICFNWKNFQPLQKWRNRRKAARIVEPQLALL